MKAPMKFSYHSGSITVQPPTRPLRIPYVTEDFPRGSIPNVSGELAVSWDEVLWAAVTVGRPSRHYVFRYGTPSIYEAIFRLSLVRMALEQSGPRGSRLRRTDAAKTLDPTEKGAVNYFLGMVFCKLFATRLLNTTWLLHLDVWKDDLQTVLTGRSRPDLVGRDDLTMDWHAFESKGRISPPGTDVKSKAKDQATRIISVASKPCKYHVGAITYFKKDVLNFYWRDPVPQNSRQINIPFSDDDLKHYYRPIIDLLHSRPDQMEHMREEPSFADFTEEDFQLTVHPEVLAAITENRWKHLPDITQKIRQKDSRYNPDGLALIAGKTWREPFSKKEQKG
jgi:hypothetical protein